MYSILHRVVIEASNEAVFNAIKTEEGITAWWSKAKIQDDRLTLAFGESGEHEAHFNIKQCQANKNIVWQCVAGPWQETGEFEFNISEDERGTCLHFAHHGWLAADDFYQHCNCKWAFFLASSLKAYLETGLGLPHPNDPNI